MKFRNIAALLLLSASATFVKAQNTDQPQPQQYKFDQHKVFSPLFYPDKSTVFRSASGAPGARYWQNRADYKIEASLDTAKHRVTGSTTITYTNNSPDGLTFLW